MSSIESLCAALDEVAIARDVGIPHDEARASYGLRRNTVSNFNEFNEVITNYYAYPYRPVRHPGRQNPPIRGHREG